MLEEGTWTMPRVNRLVHLTPLKSSKTLKLHYFIVSGHYQAIILD